MKNWATLLIGTFVFISVHQAAASAYLKFDGIEGESLDREHRGWIEILSFSHDVSREKGRGPGNGRTARRGRTSIGDLVVVKELDRSSPKLAEALIKGMTIPQVVMHVTTPSSDPDGIEPLTFYTYELKNVQVVSYNVQGEGGVENIPLDSFALNFEEIKVTYLPIKDIGAGPVEFATGK